MPLTRLDVDLALGKVELAGDALADDELWALEDDNDFFDPRSPGQEPDWDSWDTLED